MGYNELPDGSRVVESGSRSDCPNGSVYFGPGDSDNTSMGWGAGCWSAPQMASYRDNRYPWQSSKRPGSTWVGIPFPPANFATEYRFAVQFLEQGIERARWVSQFFDYSSYLSEYAITATDSRPVIWCPPEHLLCGNPVLTNDWCCLDCASTAANLSAIPGTISSISNRVKQMADQWRQAALINRLAYEREQKNGSL